MRWARYGREADDVALLTTRLRSIKGGPGYRVDSQIFESENHLSVVPASLSRGLTFAFSLTP